MKVATIRKHKMRHRMRLRIRKSNRVQSVNTHPIIRSIIRSSTQIAIIARSREQQRNGRLVIRDRELRHTRRVREVHIISHMLRVVPTLLVSLPSSVPLISQQTSTHQLKLPSGEHPAPSNPPLPFPGI